MVLWRRARGLIWVLREGRSFEWASEYLCYSHIVSNGCGACRAGDGEWWPMTRLRPGHAALSSVLLLHITPGHSLVVLKA